jgi:polysaccharide export outer membrane protein
MHFPVSRHVLRARRWACAASLFALAGCSIVPGTYLGVKPRPSPSDSSDTSSSDDVAARADIFTISPNSIEQLDRAEQAFQSKVAAARARSEAALLKQPAYQYLVGPHDVLHITVWNHPELTNPSGAASQESGSVVGNNGTFYYPFAGSVQAGGRTLSQIREELARGLNKYFVDPQVDVAMLTYRSQSAYALGQVAKPGVIPITDVPLTITDLIARSGGVTPAADLRAATLLTKGKSKPIDLYALYYKGDISQDVRVSAGDILTIPESRYDKIFVLGEIAKPQSIVMPRGRISLAEAISDSGGFNPLTANAGQVYVIRGGANNRPQIWYLNAHSPDALVLADRFDLQARDIVYVDPAAIARFGRVLNNIIPTATLLRATVQYP